MKQIMPLSLVLLFAAAGTAMSYPVTLNYDAEAYAYTYAHISWTDTDSDNQFSNNAAVLASAYAETYRPGDTMFDPDLEMRSWTDASVNGVYDSAGAEITSTVKGRGIYSLLTASTSPGAAAVTAGHH